MAKQYSFIPALEPKFYPHIGRAVVLWAYLEVDVDQYLNVRLKQPETWADPRSAKIDKRLPRAFKARAKLWRQMDRIHFDGPILEWSSSFIERLVEARDERDKIAHGLWVLGSDATGTSKAYRELVRDGIYIDILEPITTTKIKETSHTICDLIREFRRFKETAFPPVQPPAPSPKLTRLGSGPIKRLPKSVAI